MYRAFSCIGIVEKAKEEMKNRFIMSTNTPSQVFAEVINNLPREALKSLQMKTP